MHGKLKRTKIRRREAVTNWAITIATALFTFTLLIAARNQGIPKKWVTAVMGTVFSFGSVIYAFRERLLQWSFWAAFALCLAVHSVGVWAFFQYVLADFRTVSIWFWLPVMLVETFVLSVVVKRIAEKLTGKHETIKLSF
jgi:hypothetical protein